MANNLQASVDYDLLNKGAEKLDISTNWKEIEGWQDLRDYTAGTFASDRAKSVLKSHGIEFADVDFAKLDALEDETKNIYRALDDLAKKVENIATCVGNFEKQIIDENNLAILFPSLDSNLDTNFESDYKDKSFYVYKHSYNFEDRMSEETYNKTYENLKEMLEDETGATVSKEMSSSWFNKEEYKTYREQEEDYMQKYIEQGYDEKTARKLAKLDIAKEAFEKTGADTVDGFDSSQELKKRYDTLLNESSHDDPKPPNDNKDLQNDGDSGGNDDDRTINNKKQEGSKDESKDGTKDESKDGTKDESKDGTKDESKDGTKDESKDGTKDESKDESKDETKEEAKEENTEKDPPKEENTEKDPPKDDGDEKPPKDDGDEKPPVEKPYDKSDEEIKYQPTDNQNQGNHNYNSGGNNNASTSVGEAIKEDGVDQTELETDLESDIDVPEEDITKIETPKIPTTDEVKESSGGSGVIPAVLGLGAAAVAGVGAAKIISDKKQKEMSLEDDYDGDSMDTEGEYSENYGDLEEYSNYSSDEDEDYGMNSQEPDFKYRAGTVNREDLEGSSMSNIEYEPETETDFDLEKELNNREGE